MHPLIKRVVEYKQHYIDQNDGQHPKIPFIVFESEWDQFIQDPNVQRSLAEAKLTWDAKLIMLRRSDSFLCHNNA